MDDVYDDVCELPRPTSSSEIVPLASNNFKNGRPLLLFHCLTLWAPRDTEIRKNVARLYICYQSYVIW